jgi:hypothetical protein
MLTCFTGSQYVYCESPVSHYSHSVMAVVLKIMHQEHMRMVTLSFQHMLHVCVWYMGINDIPCQLVPSGAYVSL